MDPALAVSLEETMKKFLIGLLALIGGLSILAMVGLVGIGLLSAMSRPGVPSRTILEIDFEGGVIEAVPDDAFAQLLLDNTLKLRDVIDALDRGAEDRRVKGLIARIGGGEVVDHRNVACGYY